MKQLSFKAKGYVSWNRGRSVQAIIHKRGRGKDLSHCIHSTLETQKPSLDHFSLLCAYYNYYYKHSTVYILFNLSKAMLSLKKPEWFKKRFCRFFWPCFLAPTVQQQPLCGVSTGSDHSCRHSVTSKTLEHSMCLCSSAQYSEEPLPLCGK